MILPEHILVWGFFSDNVLFFQSKHDDDEQNF